MFNTSDIETTKVDLEMEVKTEAPEKEDVNLPFQIIKIEAKKSIVIETADGIVLSIPSYAFIDKNNKQVQGDIELKIQEAIDPIDILNSGLSTLSNGELNRGSTINGAVKLGSIQKRSCIVDADLSSFDR